MSGSLYTQNGTRVTPSAGQLRMESRLTTKRPRHQAELVFRLDPICNTCRVTAAGLAPHARSVPNKDALIMGAERLSYAELDARVNRLAHALRRAGVGIGDTVGAALHNGFEWYELLNAVGKLGAQ